MDTGGYSSTENQCHHCTVLSQNAVTHGQRAPKMHLMLEASAVLALANLVKFDTVGEDEVGTNFDN